MLINKKDPPFRLWEGTVIVAVLILVLFSQVSGQVPEGTLIENEAHLSYRDPAGFTYTAISNKVVTIVSTGYKIEISKSVNASVVSPGDVLIYQLFLYNSGNRSALNISLMDTLSAGLTIVSTNPIANLNGQIISWDLIDIEVGSSTEFQIIAEVGADLQADSEIKNSAWYQDDNEQIGRSETVTFRVGSLPNLTLSNIVDRDIADVNDTLMYRITVKNTGNTTSTATYIHDDLPEYVTLLSATNNATENGGVITWDIGELAPGDSIIQSVITVVNSFVPINTSIINIAHAVNAQGVQRQSETRTLLNQWVLPVQKSAPAGDYSIGDTITFTIVLDNTSESEIYDVIVIDTIPSPLEFLSASGGAVVDGSIVNWNLGSLSPGSRTSLHISTQVGVPTVPTSGVTNRVIVTTLNAGTNKAAHFSILNTFPALNLTKSGDMTAVPGDTISYMLSLTNDGTGNASAVVIIDTLSSLLEFIDSPDDHSYDIVSRTVSWNIGSLSPSDGRTVSMRAYVNKPLSSGIIDNMAWATSDEGAITSASTSTIIKTPILTLNIQSDSSVVFAGDEFSYTLEYSNIGDTTATGVFIVDTLSEFVEYVTSSGSSIYDESSHTVRWDISDFALSEAAAAKPSRSMLKSVSLSKIEGSETLTVRVKTPIPNNTNLRNAGNIFSNEGSAGSASLGLTVNSGPILILSKSAVIEVLPNDTLIYELNYSNTGSDVATGVIVRDTLGSNVSFLSATGDYDYDALSHSINWIIGDMNLTDTLTQSITVRANALLEDGEEIRNIAWIFSNETDGYRTEWITTNILPMTISLTAKPNIILGNGFAFSTLEATVKTFLGNPAPNGYPVTFSTDLGVIPTGQDTTFVADGVALSTLVSDTVLNESVIATITSKVSFSSTKFATDTTTITFIIGAFDGIVVDYTGEPIEGALVELISLSTGDMTGSDSTDENGYYLIPVFFEDTYRIIFSWRDESGEIISVVQIISIEVPNEGEVITNLNSVSGWIIDDVTGKKISEPGIQLILTLQHDSTGFGKKTVADFSDSTFTDSTGQYFFTNLESGEYLLQVNYKGIQSYGNGVLQINFNQQGLFVINANIGLTQSPFFLYKEVDLSEATIGDTLNYELNFGTNEVSVSDSVTIIDFLPQGLIYVENSVQVTPGLSLLGYDIDDNQLKFGRVGIALNSKHKISFLARISKDVGIVDAVLENIALITNGNDSTRSDNDVRTKATTKIIIPFLQVTKSVNRRVAEIGDYLTYKVTLENKSLKESAHRIKFLDLIPTGFKYVSGTTYWNDSKIPDPIITSASKKRFNLEWVVSDTLKPGESMQIKYRLISGLQSRIGKSSNEVYASGRTLGGTLLSSNTATVDVMIRPGILSDRGIIIGKVYADKNGNLLQDNNEIGIAGVELIMENGTHIVTDSFGKYSIPNVSSGIHVLRINERSLPKNYEIVINSPEFLRDPRSRLVKLNSGGIAKANFVLRKTTQNYGKIEGIFYLESGADNIQDTRWFGVGDSGITLILDDTIRVVTDSTGYYQFEMIPPGLHHIRVDSMSLPERSALSKIVDDAAVAFNYGFDFNLEDNASLRFDYLINKDELNVNLSQYASLSMTTKMLTKEFRLLNYKPWTLTLGYGFLSGKVNLQPVIISELRNVGKLMVWQSQLILIINGHTDNIPIIPGSIIKNNKELSQARADNIKKYLIDEYSINGKRIKAIGWGDEQPVLDNETDAARSLNRRVEMVLTNAEESSENNNLDFEFEIGFIGGVPITKFELTQIVPSGFEYLSGSAKIGDEIIDPEETSDSLATWQFGEWEESRDESFSFSLHPKNFEDIENTSNVRTFVTMTDSSGEETKTEGLEINITTKVEELSFKMVLKGTQFDFGSAELKPSAGESLDKLGEFLSWQPDVGIVIEGFTDNWGSLELNINLSKWRAEAVKKYLIEEHNLNPLQIQVHALGPYYPVADNSTRVGRAKNRRVEVLVNAEVGEEVKIEIDIAKESFNQELSFPKRPFEDDYEGGSITLNAGQTSYFWLNLHDIGYGLVDSVEIIVTFPEFFSELNDGYRAIQFGKKFPKISRRFSHLLEINTPKGPIGTHEIKIRYQRYYENEKIDKLEEKLLKIRIE